MTGEDAPQEARALADAVRRLRGDAGLSHAQLALQVGYSRQHVSNAERIRKGLPSESLIRALDSALDADGVLLELHTHAKKAQHAKRLGIDISASREVNPVSNDRIDGEDVDRKQFLKSAAVLGVGMLLPDARMLDASESPRVGSADLDHLEAVAGQLLETGQAQGSGRLLSRAVGAYSRSRRLLDRADYGIAVEKRLTVIVAALARRAGWLSYDNGDLDDAQAYYADSLLLGQQAHDPDIMVQAMANMAHLSLHLAQKTDHRGHARNAARLGEGALSLVRYHESPHVHALLSSRVARARGYLKDTSEAMKYAGKAWREIERAQDVPAPRWLSFVTESEIAFHDAMVRADLGDPAAAVEMLQRSVATDDFTPDARLANSLHGRAQLALVLAQHGDLSSATQEANLTVEGLHEHGVESRRTYDVLADVERLTMGDHFD